jgi:tRNA nucleotidyltransferase (CCA-adding enzyme)
MQILFVLKDMPFADIDKMAEEVSIDEIALLSLCDRLGRGEMTSEKLRKEEEDVRIFIKKCRKHLNN